MGCLYLLIHKKGANIDLNFTSSFMNVKSRGADHTSLHVEHTIDIYTLGPQMNTLLTRDQIASYEQYTFTYGFHRMAINDLSTNAIQPFEDPIPSHVRNNQHLRSRPSRKLMCTGEIYNYQQLKQENNFGLMDLQSSSDVEIILPMYIKYGLESTIKQLKGEFSFIITENLSTYDLQAINVFIVRDTFGTRPVYMIKRNDFVLFVSELKSVPKHILQDNVVQEVPPGCYWSFQNYLNKQNEFVSYSDLYMYKQIENCTIVSAEPKVIESTYQKLKEILQAAVVSCYELSDVPVGVLFSGGFNSGIVLSVLVKYLVEVGKLDNLHVFTLGELGSKDITSAQTCITFLETLYNVSIHFHIVTLDSIHEKMLLDKVEQSIERIETYDASVVRSGMLFSFLFQYISKKTDTKVLLTGYGLNELCGYQELWHMDDKLFQAKSVELLENMYMYHLLVFDKLAISYGLETRHPLLDMDFVKFILTIHPKLKKPQTYSITKPAIEKYIIRKSFDNKKFLPNETLWKPHSKATISFPAFPNIVENYFVKKYSDFQFNNYKNSLRTSLSTVPRTKEEMFYRTKFEEKYGKAVNILKKFWDQQF